MCIVDYDCADFYWLYSVVAGAPKDGPSVD